MLTALFKDLELGERIKVKELCELVRDDPTYQMKQDVLELCEQKKTSTRPTNKSQCKTTMCR